MKKNLLLWGERYLFSPTPLEWLLSILLLPITLAYCLIVWVKYKTSVAKEFDIPIVGVGNLIVGGSGKTPLTVALARRYERVAIILRGYGRDSNGMHIVSDGKKILCDVNCSGDEAMLYANLLPTAIIIVAEDRVEGIYRAKQSGAKIIFLDDAYSKHNINKLDLIIISKQKNPFCLPSGPYREKLWSNKDVLQVEEGSDFKRKVKITAPSAKMVLVTAISKPKRLDPYLTKDVIEKIYFPDHYSFNKEELEDILSKTGASTLLVTRKDGVKLNQFNLPLSFLELELEVDEKVHERVAKYAKIATDKT